MKISKEIVKFIKEEFKEEENRKNDMRYTTTEEDSWLDNIVIEDL